MKLLTSVLMMAFLVASNTTIAQKKSNSNRKIGAKQLSISTETGAYHYDTIYEVSNTPKRELFNRVKNWVHTNLKTSKNSIFFDEENNNTISASVALNINDLGVTAITSQHVEFKVVISFKDNKIRLETNSFVYRGRDGGGSIWQKPFENLDPIMNRYQKMIYEDFDGKFKTFISSLNKSVNNDGGGDW